MAHLSRIWLNPLRQQGQRLLVNPQRMHAALLGGLSRQPVTERVLWRLEVDNPHRPAVLVLTQSRPSWEHLVDQAGWPGSDEPQAQVADYAPLLERIELGREFTLRLRANPVSSKKTSEQPPAAHARKSAPVRGTRVAHRTAQQQWEWFIDRLPRWGFDLPMNSLGAPQAELIDRDRLSFAKKPGDHARVVISTATVQGLVRVNDVERARRSLLEGVGRARAYGCGLLTLAGR